MPTDDPADAPPTLSQRLDLEWTRLRRKPHVLRTVGHWQILDGPVTDLDTVLVSCGYRVAPTPIRNVVLGRLVERARHDELAARIVLQRLMPGLLATVRRRAARAGSDGLFEELAGWAWVSIRTANVRPGSEAIAASLISDAYHRAFVAPTRRRSASEVPWSPGQLEQAAAAPIEPTAFEELVDVVGEARRGGLPDEDLDLVVHLLRTGSPAVLAAERNVTPRTVRNHRARATFRIHRLTAAA